MGRPSLEIGKPGAITIREVRPKVFQARCRYRDYDGVTRAVTAQRKSRTAAQNALLTKIGNRTSTGSLAELKPESRFADAAALWLIQVQQTQQGTTYVSYRQWLTSRVLPDIGQMRLQELRTGYLDAYFTQLRQRGFKANTLRQIRKVIRGPLTLAIKHEAIPYNPVDNVTKITGRHQSPRALTGSERTRFLTWLEASSSDPVEREAQETARRRDLPDIVRVMLGTGLRVGELMALRWTDLDLEGAPLIVNGQPAAIPLVRVTHNVARVIGEGLVLHEGKTESAVRTVPLPRFVVAVLTARRERMRDLPDDAPVFCAMTPTGPGWRDPGKVTAWVREVRGWVGLEWMTSHTWRKTAATIMDEAGLTARDIANQLGHNQVSVTQNVYLGRGVTNPAGANALDAAFAND